MTGHLPSQICARIVPPRHESISRSLCFAHHWVVERRCREEGDFLNQTVISELPFWHSWVVSLPSRFSNLVSSFSVSWNIWPRSWRRPLSATHHHPTTSLVGISWHCNEPCMFMSSILTISVTTTHCIPSTYKRIFISMTYKNSKKIK